jgi:hypothetical protein
MMSRPVLVTLIAVVLAIPGMARSDPSSYDECILDAMKGVSSDVAARAIIESCQRLFPAAAVEIPEESATPVPVTEAPPPEQEVAPAAAPQSASAPAAVVPAAVAVVPQSVEPVPVTLGPARQLTDDELDKLEYRGYFFGTTYRVKVFNGNEDLTLTELTIAVWDKEDIDGLETYRSEVDVAPSDEGTAQYTVVYDGQEATWAWKVVGAKGAE